MPLARSDPIIPLSPVTVPDTYVRIRHVAHRPRGLGTRPATGSEPANLKWFRPRIAGSTNGGGFRLLRPPHDLSSKIKASSRNDTTALSVQGVHCHLLWHRDYIASAHSLTILSIKTFMQILIDRSIGDHVESSGNIKANLLQRRLSVTKKGEY